MQTIPASDRELLQKLLGRVSHVGAPAVSFVFLFKGKRNCKVKNCGQKSKTKNMCSMKSELGFYVPVRDHETDQVILPGFQG